MTVYIDIVIIENLIINYFLILITTQIIGIKTKEINMFLASLLGSVYTLFIFLPKLNFLTNIIGKCIVVIIMMIISISRKKVAVILKASITFFMISFMFVGICFFFSLIQNNYDITKAFVIEKYSSKYLIFAAIIIYIIFTKWSAAPLPKRAARRAATMTETAAVHWTPCLSRPLSALLRPDRPAPAFCSAAASWATPAPPASWTRWSRKRSSAPMRVPSPAPCL